MSLGDKIRKMLGIKEPPPVLVGPYGTVTESARLQCAMNMALDANVRLRVEQVVIKEMGGDVEKGLVECHRRYPEAYYKW